MSRWEMGGVRSPAASRACGALLRFCGQGGFSGEGVLPVAEAVFQRFDDPFGGGVSDDHPEDAPGGVAVLPVLFRPFAGDFGDQVAEPDDRNADRVDLEHLRVEGFEEPAVRAVGAELLFTQNHFTLRGEPFGGELRITDHGGEHVDRGFQMDSGELGVVGGVVEAGVGVDRTAEAVDGVRRRGAGIVAAALKEHVLQKMRKTGAEVSAFVNAAGFDETLHFDRVAGAGQDENTHPVFTGVRDDIAVKVHAFSDGIRRIRNEITFLRPAAHSLTVFTFIM